MSTGFLSTASAFLNANDDTIIGSLVQSVAATGIAEHRSAQIHAWQTQLQVLRDALADLLIRLPPARNWQIILEYELPRRQKRPDVVVLADDILLVIEFKVGSGHHDSNSRWQVENYCLNLRDFHLASAGRTIVPILCATEAPSENLVRQPTATWTGLLPVRLANRKNLSTVLETAFAETSLGGQPIDVATWINSPYRPTVNIIEAAQCLYEGNSVREINHRYARDLDATTQMLVDVIQEAKRSSQRVVCFVTGVPGAGKTLVGLEVVHSPAVASGGGPSGMFLSGNGPLVKIIREALVISEAKAGRSRQEAEHRVTTFVRNVHEFLTYHRKNPTATPPEHVVVFDEAQRAWDSAQMKKKQDVEVSEAEELLSVMMRPTSWSVVVALVGGGQEIYTGEAGLEAWGLALQAKSEWKVVASQEAIDGGISVAGHSLFPGGTPPSIDLRYEPLAHLSVGKRSLRAESLTSWVNQFLEGNASAARGFFPERSAFPFLVTRDLEAARTWLRKQCPSDDEFRRGLVASSEDPRLRAYGLERSSGFRRGYPFEKWFLESSDDYRASDSLEVAASEFECQGLELDWIGMCWGGDLTIGDDGQWDYRKLRGKKWQQMHDNSDRNFVKNRYRVLLTRARLGMIIWVPSGSEHDMTRDAGRLDRLYEFIKEAGVPDLIEGFDS